MDILNANVKNLLLKEKLTLKRFFIFWNFIEHWSKDLFNSEQYVSLDDKEKLKNYNEGALEKNNGEEKVNVGFHWCIRIYNLWKENFINVCQTKFKR